MGNINLAQSHTKKWTIGSKLGQAPLYASQKMGKILFDGACPYEGIFQDDSGHGKEQIEIWIYFVSVLQHNSFLWLKLPKG